MLFGLLMAAPLVTCLDLSEFSSLHIISIMVPPYTITRLNNNTVEKKKLSDFVSNPKNIKNIFWNNYQDGCVHIIKSLS